MGPSLFFVPQLSFIVSEMRVPLYNCFRIFTTQSKINANLFRISFCVISNSAHHQYYLVIPTITLYFFYCVMTVKMIDIGNKELFATRADMVGHPVKSLSSIRALGWLGRGTFMAL